MKQQFMCSMRHAIIWLVVAFLVYSSTRLGGSYLLEPIKSSLFVKETSSALIPRNQSSYSSTSERKEVRIPTATNTTKPLRHNVRPFQDSSKFLPTTSLASRQHCEPGPHQPLSRVSAFTNYANSSDYWTDLKYYPANLPVVCEFNNLLTSATHFPHAMQQFYGCFSYWQEYPNNRPVLLLSHKIQKKLQRNPFLKGTLQVFQSQLQVEVTDKESFTQQNNNSAINPQSITISGGYILKHAKKLNQLVRKELNLPDDSSKSCNQDKPRISILNRRKSVGRSIINAEILSEMPSMKNLSRNDEVLVEYFEGLDFSEQVSFFQSTDILIAPHGAQLTGAAFLDAPCSHLVELFPKGYAIPNFFGSLAINSGTFYYYLYMSDHSAASEQADTLLDRAQARSANLCPSPDMIVDTVRELVQNWRGCCASSRTQRRR